MSEKKYDIKQKEHCCQISKRKTDCIQFNNYSNELKLYLVNLFTSNKTSRQYFSHNLTDLQLMCAEMQLNRLMFLYACDDRQQIVFINKSTSLRATKLLKKTFVALRNFYKF